MKRTIIFLILILSVSGLFAEVLFNRKLENKEFKIEKISDYYLLTTLEDTKIKGNYISCVVRLFNCDKYDIAELISALSEEESYYEAFKLTDENSSNIKKTGEDVDFRGDKLIEYYFYDFYVE